MVLILQPLLASASTDSLEAWVAEALQLGLVVRPETATGPLCRPGEEIEAFRSGELRVPQRYCTVTLGRPNFSRLVQLSVATFSDADGLAAVVDGLHRRCIDGCDPTEEGNKAIASGWVHGQEIWWLTTHSAAERATHCRLLALAGGPALSWCTTTEPSRPRSP